MTARRAWVVSFLLNAVVGLVAVAGSGGCGGSSSSGSSPSSPSTTPPPIAAQYVSITGSFGFASAAGTAQLRANAVTASGPQDVTGQAAWRSSNDSIVTVSSGGLVTAKGAGLAVITATYQALSGYAGISVATPVDVTGTWSGATVNPTSSILLQLTQTGESVTGTSTLDTPAGAYKGSLTATVNGGTVIMAGSVSSAAGSLFGSWTDERCALEGANTMKCLNPMTNAQGALTLMEITFTRS